MRFTKCERSELYLVAVAQKQSGPVWSDRQREHYPSVTHMNNQNLKLAIQKNGRLTKDTLSFLRKSGLEFESSQQKLFSSCRNLPLEILYVRDNDITNYVHTGIVDLWILRHNLIN